MGIETRKNWVIYRRCNAWNDTPFLFAPIHAERNQYLTVSKEYIGIVEEGMNGNLVGSILITFYIVKVLAIFKYDCAFFETLSWNLFKKLYNLDVQKRMSKWSSSRKISSSGIGHINLFFFADK